MGHKNGGGLGKTSVMNLSGRPKQMRKPFLFGKETEHGQSETGRDSQEVE